jgi:hypothetical protein
MQMSKKSWLIAMTAVAGLGVIACGGDEEDTTPATTPVGSTTDGAVQSSAGDAAIGSFGGDAGMGCMMFPIVGSVKVCTQASGQPGYQTCTNGVPQGSCNPIMLPGSAGDGGAAAGDGGSAIGQFLGDSGLGFTGDGGIMIGDASINIEAGTLKCPSGLECNSLIGSFTGGISACTMPGALLPDSCSGSGACMVGTAKGSCLSGFCVAPCN